MTPAGTSNELDVQNEWEENTHTHTTAGRPGSSKVTMNLMIRWDVSSIPANEIFLTKKLKLKLKMPNGWRTIKPFVPASPDQGHYRPCLRDVGRIFQAGVRPDSPSRRRIPSCHPPGPGRGVVVELGQRGAH